MSDYAPEYSQEEKLRYFIKVCAISIPMSFILLYWFTPWFHQFIISSSCVSVVNTRGFSWVIYGIFAVLPCIAGAALLAMMGPKLLASIKQQQYPLPGVKVLSRTKYLYGNAAKIRAYVVLALILSSFIIGMQGIFWAHDFIAHLQASTVTACF